ncbi:MAG: UDP-glucose 4-epimerase [Microbacteriaceae bacterium]|jgi:nucleoside-diphosphate-sugar epimerase|nr:UDP-glucose 4-epimerase [Microbacteriaceae bacterium]
MRILVTGGSGKLGSAVVAGLLDAGHAVVNVDAVGQRGDAFSRVDLADYGQTIDAVFGIDSRHDGVDAIVHLAAIPAGGLHADSATFHNNIAVTFNVFQAARRAGVKRIVYASSETLLGIPFEIDPPYLPIDEEYPSRPESMYAVVKHLEEELAQKLVRWDPELSITALRFSNVMDEEDYAAFEGFQDDAALRRWNAYGYIDSRDGAQAVLRALELSAPGFDRFIIAAADTVMRTPSAELAASAFAGVEVTRALSGNESLLSIEKAKRVLGYAPRHSWQH